MTSSSRIISEAKKLVGIPYKHLGRSNSGVDCAGLIYLAFKRSNIILPKFDDKGAYRSMWWKEGTNEEKFINALLNNGFEIIDDPIPGAIITFRLYSKDAPVNHSGILINNFRMVHAKRGKNNSIMKVSLEDLTFNNTNYINRIAYYLKYKDVNYV